MSELKPTNVFVNPESKTTVFLGGTIGYPIVSIWRDDLVPYLNNDVDVFNPVVADWNDQARINEEYAREHADFVVYGITPEGKGLFSIYEITSDSFLRPKNTILMVLGYYGGETFSEEDAYAWEQIVKKIASNGVRIAHSIQELANILNDIN